MYLIQSILKVFCSEGILKAYILEDYSWQSIWKSQRKDGGTNFATFTEHYPK